MTIPEDHITMVEKQTWSGPGIALFNQASSFNRGATPDLCSRLPIAAIVGAAGLPTAEFTHAWVGVKGIHMSHPLPEIPRCPAHCVLYAIMTDHMTPARGSALWAE